MTSRGKGGRPGSRGGRGNKSKTPARASTAYNSSKGSVAADDSIDKKEDMSVNGLETSNVNSASGPLQATNSGEKNVSRQMTSQSKQNDSRFIPLEKVCTYCDMPCIEVTGLISDNLCCESCKRWSHIGCENGDRDMLIELRKKGSFICVNCKDFNGSSSEIDRSSSEIESSMNSEDRHRAEYDSEMDEDELLRLDENERESNFTPELESTEVNREGGSVLESTAISNSVSATVLKSTVTPGKTQLPNQPTVLSTQTQDSSQNKQSQNENDFEKMDFDDSEQTRPKVFENSTNSNTKQNGNQSQMVNKLDHLMNMFQEVREDIYNVNTRVTNLDKSNQQYINNSTAQITEEVQKNMKEFIHLQNQQNREENDKRIRESIQYEIDNKIGLKIDNIFTNRTGPTVDYVMNQRMTHLEKKLEDSITNKVGKMVDEKIETELDEFQEMLWRQKNVLIVGLPESNNPVIHQRQIDDLNEIHRIFNLFVRFDDRDIEGLPVRLGRISDRPRTLRITLKSERMVKEVTNKARDLNHLLNPTEKDNRKKIYLNKDFTERERRNRQNLQEEKKERERKGEKVVIIKRKVVPINQDPRGYRNTPYQGQNNRDRDLPNKNDRNDTRDRKRMYRQDAREQSRSRLPSRERYMNENRDNLDREYYRHSVRTDYRQGRGSNNSDGYPDDRRFDRNAPRNETEQRQRQRSVSGRRNQIGQERNGIPQGEAQELGRSPLNRAELPTLGRDEQGPYLRDDQGRYVRGAESSALPDRDNRENEDYRSKYRRYSSDRDRVENHREDYHRPGRSIRQSSTQQNKNQPGSRPYGNTSRR